MQNMPIGIFRGDDTDAFSYQTIVGTINTDLDLTGCKAVFRYLDFSMEFDPIPEDKKITIIIPADETKKFPPGLGYASLRVYDSEGRLKTFSNRIMVFVATKTPMFGSDEFEVDFNVRQELAPLKIFVGPNPDDFDEYRGYLEKVIDRASATKYGLAILLDAIDSDLGASDGVAATPVAVKAAYAAIIEKLTNDYYTKDETDEAIDRVAAYYITYDAAGNPFPTYAALANAQTVYSGGKVRTPTRNDYCVVLADETHDNAEYRYIYAVAEGQTTGSWQPQFPVEGVMTIDSTVTKNSPNPVSGGGVWSAIWGTATTAFSSLYDWCVAQLAGKASTADVDPLLFAQYYPEGNVKSAAEFTPGIKYGSFDDVHHTVSVLPFCNTGTAANDNSSLVGRVVIPPFVDAQGNPYISDDGTRYKVVGVQGGDSQYVNDNLTAIVAPNTVTNIEDGTFRECAMLSSISLPAATNIGYHTFTDCDALTSVMLPAATTIEAHAFETCDSLTSISLLVATSVGNYAFAGCTELASVDFGDTPRSDVPTLGEDAFIDVPTSCKIIVPYTQYDAWIAADGWRDLPQEFVRHAEKADKPATFTTGNLAALDADGNPTDSGVKASDKLDSTSAAPAFSTDSSTQYAVGSHVTYNGKLYKCTTATTGGTWVAASWTADTMTDPDAVLDVTSQNQLRVVAKDGTLLWAQGYDLASTSSATLACDATNNFTFADGATSQAFTLPTAPTGKVGDFGLDIDNSASTGAATISFTNITNNTASVVIPKGENLNDMLSIAAGELARFYITLSTFRVNKLPTWHIVKQVVENGGAQS
jgi:hypothetical protein